MPAPSDLGREAANLKWKQDLSWPEVYEHFDEEAQSKVRSAARRYKDDHPDEYPTAKTFDGPKQMGHKFDVDGNEATATSVDPQIQTKEQLIEACNIDEDEWVCTDFNVTVYQGWRGNSVKNLTFDEGKISGFIRDGGILRKNLYSVTGKFVKREPEPLRPTFRLLQTTASYDPPPPPKTDGIVKSLLFSDVHFGFRKNVKNAKLTELHDRETLSIILQVAQDYQPHYIGILGDLFDMAEWSTHWAKEPEFFFTTQPALDEAFWFLETLRQISPEARIVWVEGNHDVRMPNAVRDNMIEASRLNAVGTEYPLLSFENLLDLDSLHVDFVSGYAQDQDVYKPAPWLRWTHGHIARAPGNTAKAMLKGATGWIAFGHIHRNEIASKTLHNGDKISSVSFGCCCHTDGRIPGSSPDSQYQKRFGIMEFDPHVPSPAIETIAIDDGSAIWRGRRYAGEDYTDTLRELYPIWNW